MRHISIDRLIVQTTETSIPASNRAWRAPAIALPRPVLTESAPRPAICRRDRVYRVALVAADLAAALMVVGLGVEWLGGTGPSWSALLLLAVVPPVHSANGLYRRDEQVLHKSTLDEAPRIFQAATLATVLVFLLESAMLRDSIGATVVALTWLGLAVAVPACRTLARSVLRRTLAPERCLVLGTHEQGRRLAAKLTPEAGVEAQLVGLLPLTLDQANGDPGSVVTPELLAEVVEALEVDRIVVAADSGAPQVEVDAIQAAKVLGVKVSVMPRLLEVMGSAATYDYVDGLTILSVPRFGLSRRARLIKRAFDMAGSAALLALAAPLMGIIALAVKLTSAGPILFRQTRIGRDGRPFAMLKFRSMHHDAEETKDQLRHRNEADGLFKIADDPRITRVGRVLRRTSLDELPQLLNVILGEMSLVGPRPLIPEEDRQIQGWHRRRLHLTPGMTGPWQVLGSARIPLREMVTIDYLYVAHWSLWDDFKILLRTAGTVVGQRGR
jgi:exopolysaccharide biosynthesis polyprenyl glycosylphosphotransferase